MSSILDLTRGEIYVTPEMIEAGVEALAEGRRSALHDREIVRVVYAAMIEESGRLGRGNRLMEFALETIANIRGALEELENCERKAVNHIREIKEKRSIKDRIA